MTEHSAVPGPVAADEVDLIATAVLGCPAVAGLDTGGLRMVVTYLPGRRVVGVRTDAHTIEVAVVGVLGVPVPTLDRQVRTAVASYAGGRRVDVHVADLVDPSAGAAPAAAPTGATLA